MAQERNPLEPKASRARTHAPVVGLHVSIVQAFPSSQPPQSAAAPAADASNAKTITATTRTLRREFFIDAPPNTTGDRPLLRRNLREPSVARQRNSSHESAARRPRRDRVRAILMKPQQTPAPDRAAVLNAFMRAFDAGAYFDAHEILEAFWVGYRGDDRDFYRGLIQAAVALHHRGTGNAVGAASVGARARSRLVPYAPRYEAIDVDAILARLGAA